MQRKSFKCNNKHKEVRIVM